MKIWNKMKTTRTNTIICFIVIIFILIIPFCVTCVHASPDDDFMLLFASGSYTGTPSPYLIYSNIIYGYFISSLYKMTHEIEWYSVIQYILHVLSICVILRGILQAVTNKVLKILSIILILIIGIGCGACLQYTFLAAELSFASIVILLVYRGHKRYIFAALVFWVATLIRLTGAALPYMICWPILIFPFRWENSIYRERCIYLCFLLPLMAFTYFTDKVVYENDEDWKEFVQYNNLRQYINDNPSEKECIRLFKDGTAQRNESELMIGYRTQDGTILSQYELKEMVDYLKENRIGNIKKSFNGYYYTYNYGVRIIFTLFVGILVLSVLYKKKRWTVTASTISLFMFILANLYLMSRSRPKEPVMLALILCLIFVFVYCLQFVEYKKYNVVLCVLMLVGTTAWLARTFTVSRNSINKNLIINNQLETLAQQTEDRKILFHNNTYFQSDMFSLSQSLIGKKIVRSGWTTNSPHTRLYYEGLKSLSDYHLPFIYNKDCEHYIEICDSLIKYHYGKDCNRVKLSQRGDFILAKYE